MLDWLKLTSPKSLMARMLIIIVVPVIISQIIVSIVFFHRHWDTVEKKMMHSLVSEISFINNLYKKGDKKILETFQKHNSIIIQIKNKRLHLTDNIKETEFYGALERFKEDLRKNIPEKFEISYSFKYRQVIVDIHHKDQDLLLIFSRKKLYTSTTSIFIYWVIGSSLLFLVITILFAKNQIRSITKLSSAANDLGRGRKIVDFKPQGAIEVKKAGYAFLEMQRRIENHINQRTSLLAGVSHDLKTPLTSMKLELEMTKDSQLKENLLEDLSRMEQTLDDYLEFASSENKQQHTSLINLSDLLKEISVNYEKKFQKFDFSAEKNIYANIKANQFRRAIVNLLDNAAKFATEIKFITKQVGKNIMIEIHDNGPGISAGEREKVFKPFYRIESSRNKKTGGVGLGMSIANDIISKHGGQLNLGNSYLGGLLITIRIPI